MKTNVLASVVALMLVFAQTLAYGEQYRTSRADEYIFVPEDMPITVKNPEGARKFYGSGQITFDFGSTCMARGFGKFTLLGDLSATRVVIRYETNYGRDPKRNDCPDHTYAVMTRAQFAELAIGITPGMTPVEREKKMIDAVASGKTVAGVRQ